MGVEDGVTISGSTFQYRFSPEDVYSTTWICCDNRHPGWPGYIRETNRCTPLLIPRLGLYC